MIIHIHKPKSVKIFLRLTAFYPVDGCFYIPMPDEICHIVCQKIILIFLPLKLLLLEAFTNWYLHISSAANPAPCTAYIALNHTICFIQGIISPVTDTTETKRKQASAGILMMTGVRLNRLPNTDTNTKPSERATSKKVTSNVLALVRLCKSNSMAPNVVRYKL